MKQKAIRSRRLERLVLWRLIKDALRAGYTISLHDGEEWTVTRSKDRRAILAACMSVDEENMRFRTSDGTSMGTVFLVYGNSGWDVICDYSDTRAMDDLLTPIMDWAEKLDERTQPAPVSCERVSDNPSYGEDGDLNG